MKKSVKLPGRKELTKLQLFVNNFGIKKRGNMVDLQWGMLRIA